MHPVLEAGRRTKLDGDFICPICKVIHVPCESSLNTLTLDFTIALTRTEGLGSDPAAAGGATACSCHNDLSNIIIDRHLAADYFAQRIDARSIR